MTKEAEMLALAERIESVFPIQLKQHDGTLADHVVITLTIPQCDRVVEALRAAARPSPDAGLVEREPLARIIDPDSFIDSRYEDDRTPIEREIVGRSRDYNKKEAFKKADAILALLSPRAVAGEPVAADAGERIRAAAVKLVMAGFMAQKHGLEDEIKKAERELLWFACDEISRHLERMPTPAPLGRDPAHWTQLQELWTAISGIEPRCRDCADSDGTCCNDKDHRPCDPHARALFDLAKLKSRIGRDEISRHLERMPTPAPSGRDPATIEACAKVADGLAAKQRATNEKYPDHAKAYATWQNAVFVFEEAAAAIRALNGGSK